MGLGIKRLFKKKKDGAAKDSPPKSKGAPNTPPTQPIKEDPPARSHSDELPVRNLLDQLNIYEEADEGDGLNHTGEMELVLGELPRENLLEQTAATTPTKVSPLGDAPIELSTQPTNRGIEIGPDNEVKVEAASKSEDKKIDNDETDDDDDDDNGDEIEGVGKSVDSPLRPRRLDPVGGAVVTVAQKSVSEEDRPTLADADENSKNESGGMARTLASTLTGIVERAKQCAGDIIVEPVERLLPTVDNACIPIGRADDQEKERPTLVRQYSYYDDQFALKILDELINVGYATVNHQQLEAGEDGKEGDWVGRSVTIILRPGICNRLQVQAPYLEWTTLGGGQENKVETTTVSLLDIHSIATSNADDMELGDDDEAKEDKSENGPNTAEKEDLQCFFSMTTKQGQIHVMEAITADESQRLVAGIKNLESRLSRQLVAGEKAVLSDFFDNAQEPEEIKLSTDAAMLRISNALVDYLSRA